jgi:hypothetical protein
MRESRPFIEYSIHCEAVSICTAMLIRYISLVVKFKFEKKETYLPLYFLSISLVRFVSKKFFEMLIL